VASVPRSFLELAQDVVQHCSDDRFALLYGLLWRLTHGARNLLEVPSDPLVRRLTAMAKAVREETAAIEASLRFHTIAGEAGEWDIAWHAPEHHVLESVAASFARSRGRRCWSILTPVRSAHWSCGKLTMAPGAPASAGASAEGLERHWRRHYATLFAPARADVDWAGLPEATLVRPLFGTAETHARRALDESLRESLANPHRKAAAQTELVELREDVARCLACPLYKTATQAVVGEGPPDARIMLVGEQPGDQEDLQGRPFVGPAGQILDRALAEAGIARAQVYVTNAVKHFKFTPRGKRRIHQKPELREIAACRSWLEHEIALVKPKMIVALGASAARALLGRTVPVGASRGRLFSLKSSIPVAVTIHPSYVLRLPVQEQAAAEYARLVEDLKAANRHVVDTTPAETEPMLFA
jgi:DNA polymerase